MSQFKVERDSIKLSLKCNVFKPDPDTQLYDFLGHRVIGSTAGELQVNKLINFISKNIFKNNYLIKLYYKYIYIYIYLKIYITCSNILSCSTVDNWTGGKSGFSWDSWVSTSWIRDWTSLWIFSARASTNVPYLWVWVFFLRLWQRWRFSIFSSL